ncbi:MAG: hypothetical protein LC795_00480 [Acidobacteria bacterium]|nr:hypothetical protein [Acidobacteriota bacterium]
MKRIVTLCCVYLTLAAAVCAQEAGRRPAQPPAPLPLKHGGKIESAYDGFARETVFKLKRMSVTCEAARGLQGALKGLCVSLQVSLHCPGRQLEYVRRATVRLTFEAKDWDARHPVGQRDLSAVADGETVRLGRMTLVSQGVSEGWFDEDAKETLEVSLPYETFLKLARAAYVEMSVGKTTFPLRDKNIAALRDLNNRVLVTPGAAAQPGGGN